MRSLEEQVAAAVAKFEAKVDRTTERAVEAIAAYGISLSPEVSGRFKANFNYGLDQANASTSQDTSSRTLNFTAAIPEKAGGHVHYISNSLPYALRLEFGYTGPDSLGRTFSQLPQAIFGRMAMAAPQIIEDIARDVAQ